MTKCSISTPSKAPLVTVRKIKQKVYRKYEPDAFFNCLMDFACMTNTTSITAYLKDKENISMTSFLRYYNKSGLAEYKKQESFDASIAKTILKKYFEETTKRSKERVAAAHDSCRYLTANEEHSLVQLCIVLGSMGYGLTRDDLHGLADAVVNKDVDKRQAVPISKHVTDGLLLRHEKLVKVVAAASLDPKRARQATVEIRDAMFFKLNAYIELLHKMGMLPWKTYSEIPADAIYNMDELGNDTTKHRNKVLTKKQVLAQATTIRHAHSCVHRKVMVVCHGISPSALPLALMVRFM